MCCSKDRQSKRWSMEQYNAGMIVMMWTKRALTRLEMRGFLFFFGKHSLVPVGFNHDFQFRAWSRRRFDDLKIKNKRCLLHMLNATCETEGLSLTVMHKTTFAVDHITLVFIDWTHDHNGSSTKSSKKRRAQYGTPFGVDVSEQRHSFRLQTAILRVHVH